MRRLFFAFILHLFITLVCIGQVNQWKPVGPVYFPINDVGQINGQGRVSQLKFDPNNANRLFAVAPHAVFVSNDNAESWNVLPGTDALPSQLNMGSICIDYRNNNILYLGTGDADYYSGGRGVWKSTDGGLSFNQTNTGMGDVVVKEILMSPADPNVLVAATSGGIYRSIDGGGLWIPVPITVGVAITDMRMNASPGSTTIYAVAKSTGQFFTSTDFGTLWTTQVVETLAAANGARLAVTPANSNVIYVSYVGSNSATGNGGIVYRSTDGGLSFTKQKGDVPPNLVGLGANQNGQGNYNFNMEADPLNANILYVVGHIVWRSMDGGITWAQTYNTNWAFTIHTDMHGYRFHPNNPNLQFNINDGGVWISTDHAKTWTPKCRGLIATEFPHMAAGSTRKYMIGGGSQDNGELYNKDGVWHTNGGGDFYSAYAMDNTTGFAYYLENGTKRNIETAPNSDKVTIGLPNAASNNDRFAFSMQNSNTAFVAQNTFGLYRTINLQTSPATWKRIWTSSNNPSAVAVSPVDANIVYVLSTNKTVVRSTNALADTASFVTVSPAPQPATNPSNGGLAVLKKGVVYLSSNGYVFRSGDQGVTWTAVGSGTVTNTLNGQKIVTLIADTSHENIESIYAMTSSAVYYKDTSMTDWAYYTKNLPGNSQLTDMDICYDPILVANSMLRVSTYGRGVWESGLAYNKLVNQALPSVSVIAPVNNYQGRTRNTITLKAAASDAGGYITKVEFYNGAALLGEALTPPYNLNWIPTVAGTFPITAVAYDNDGESTVSDTVFVNIVVNPCSATPLIPQGDLRVIYCDSQELIGENGSATNAIDGDPSTIWHTRWSSNVTPPPHEIQLNLGNLYNVNLFKYLPRPSGTNGRVGQYEIYVSTDSSNWGSPVATGTFDNDGTEKEVSFPEKSGKYLRFRALTEVNNLPYTTAAELKVGYCAPKLPPTVSINAPANNTTITAGTATTISANAIPNNGGTITKMEFYQGTTLLGTSITAPYSFSWNNIPSGAYTLKAVAYDNDSNNTTSAAINVNVVGYSCNGTTYLPQSNLKVIYFDAQDTSFGHEANKAIDNNTGTFWLSQPFPLGILPLIPLPHEIQLSLGGTYQVNSFKYLPRQDGSATGRVGQYEIYVSADTTNWGTAVATGTFVNDASEKIILFTPKAGKYLRFRALTDLSGQQYTSAAELTVGYCILNALPAVTITSPANNVVVQAGATVNLNANAVDVDGTITKVDFYNGNTLLGTSTTQPYSFAWNNVAAGTYNLTAKATDNKNETGTSIIVSIKVNAAPVVNISSPANNATFDAGTTITINANASDADGTIAKVGFYQGGILLGESNASPYSFNWSNAAIGSYSLTAKATDNDGAVTTSGVVNIAVNPAVVCNTNSYEPNDKKKDAVLIPANTDIYSQIGSANDRDWYKFTITNNSDVQVTLQNLPGDYDLYVYDGPNNLIGSSLHEDTVAESISFTNLPVGTYYIKVVGYGQAYNAGICYKLNANSKNTLSPARSSVTTVNGNSFEVLVQTFKLIAWPNPSANEFQVKIEGSNKEVVQCRVFNTNGKLVKQFKVNVGETVNFGHDLMAGVYFIEAQQNAGRKVIAVIKL